MASSATQLFSEGELHILLPNIEYQMIKQSTFQG